jgi:hypothetical protein
MGIKFSGQAPAPVSAHTRVGAVQRTPAVGNQACSWQPSTGVRWSAPTPGLPRNVMPMGRIIRGPHPYP